LVTSSLPNALPFQIDRLDASWCLLSLYIVRNHGTVYVTV
jgi:hypothetical protein